MNSHDNDQAQRFDRTVRGVHDAAVAKVSSATMAQLHRRRHAALTARPQRRWAWPLGAALASVFTVAIGLGIGLGLDDGAQAPADAGGDAVALSELDRDLQQIVEIEDALDAYEESPDFYLWLGSSDATLLAME